MGKYMEGSGHECILGMTLYFPEGTEENFKGTSE